MILDDLKKFIQEYQLEEQSMLLGLSGGIDSTALFHLLIEAGIAFQVAHVDHGWREESGEEACILRRKVEELGVRWHGTKLQMKEMSEEAARNGRMRFFQEVIDAEQLKGIFLAHQKDDVIETSLKRVLEGAQLPYIGGMKLVSTYEGMEIYRPLLSFSKEELRSYLNEKNISYIEDPTNEDSRFLRGRMRTSILPRLAEEFGKGISENLYQLSIRANEWQDYLERKTEELWKGLKRGPIGSYIDVGLLKGSEKLEIRYFVQKFLKKEGVSSSRDVLEKVAGWIWEGKTDVELQLGDRTVRCEFGSLFIYGEIPVFDQSLVLKEGEWQIGKWMMKCSREEGEEKGADWRKLFLGEGSWVVPSGNYSLELPSHGARLGQKRLKKWFSENRVPCFFRYSFPVLVQDGKIVKEFLTGRNTDNKGDLKISFCLNN